MSKATFELYRDRAEEWRWRLVHDNGNVIADGGQGYASKRGAIGGIHSVKENAPEAPIEEHIVRDVEVDGGYDAETDGGYDAETDGGYDAETDGGYDG